MKYLISGFYFIIFMVSASFLFLGSQKELFPVYMVLLGLIGFLLAPGYSRSVSSDPTILSGGSMKMYILLTTLYKSIDQLILIVMFVLMGWLMEKSIYGFI